LASLLVYNKEIFKFHVIAGDIISGLGLGLFGQGSLGLWAPTVGGNCFAQVFNGN